MSIENMGYGAGGGLFTALLTYLGFKQRQDAQDKRIDALEKAVVYKDMHDVCSKSWHESLDRIDKKLDALLSKK